MSEERCGAPEALAEAMACIAQIGSRKDRRSATVLAINKPEEHGLEPWWITAGHVLDAIKGNKPVVIEKDDWTTRWEAGEHEAWTKHPEWAPARERDVATSYVDVAVARMQEVRTGEHWSGERLPMDRIATKEELRRKGAREGTRIYNVAYGGGVPKENPGGREWMRAWPVVRMGCIAQIGPWYRDQARVVSLDIGGGPGASGSPVLIEIEENGGTDLKFAGIAVGEQGADQRLGIMVPWCEIKATISQAIAAEESAE